MDFGITGKVALVAGGARGCGFGCSAELAAEGARVALTGRYQDIVDAAVDKIRAAGGEAIGIVGDMTDKADAERIIAETREKLGKISILVVNSPGGNFADDKRTERGFEASTDEQYDVAHQRFVMSLVYLARPALADMKEAGWGRVINLGSIAMKTPHLEDPMPATNLRVGVAALMKTIAHEYAPYGITANTMATGPFDSDLSREYRGSGTGVKTADWYKAMMPIGRWGRPEEMGALVAFLCSTRASYVTGETIRIDGGYTKSLF